GGGPGGCGWRRGRVELTKTTIALPSKTISHEPLPLLKDAMRLPACIALSGNRHEPTRDTAAAQSGLHAASLGKRVLGDSHVRVHLRGNCSPGPRAGLATNRCRGPRSAGSQL